MKQTFPHEYGARNDPKLQNLLATHGVAGIGVWWCIVEQLYEQNGSLPLTSTKAIAYSLHVRPKLVESVILNFDLFRHDGSRFWSDHVLHRLGEQLSRHTRRSEAGRKGNTVRWKTLPSQCDSNAIAQPSQCDSNAIAQKKRTKKTKEKEKNQKKEENKKKEEKEEDNGLKPFVEQLKQFHCQKLKHLTDKGEKAASPQKKEDHGEQKRGYEDEQLCKSIQQDFNETLNSHKSLIPRIRTISKERKLRILARVKEHGTDALHLVFTKAAQSQHLNGDNKTAFLATFDWLMLPTNFTRVLEGNYDSRPQQPKPPPRDEAYDQRLEAMRQQELRIAERRRNALTPEQVEEFFKNKQKK